MALQDAFYNPTDEQRQKLLYQSLELSKRAEDYDNIVQLLSPPPDILNFAAPMSMRGLNICILGGGLSGLTAAYELRKLGGNITVLDAESSRVGGRVYTHYFNNSEKYFGELGAMRIPVSHETSWYYINLFGLNTESLSSPRSNNFMYVNNIRMRRDFTGRNIEENLYPLYNLSEFERKTPWDELDYYASNTMFNSLNTQQRSEILKILPVYSPEYASITKLSNRQVYEDLGLSQGFVNLLSAVDPFAASLLYISHDETMSSIYTQDFFNVYRISGGMVKLPLALISSFADSNPSLGNVVIKSGCILSGIYQSADGNIIIKYADIRGVRTSQVFDLAICTIPFSTLRDVEVDPYFSDKKMQSIRELNYTDAQKTACLFNKRFWEENTDYGNVNGGVSFTDLIIQSIFYPPDHIRCEEDCSPNEPGVLIASYNLGSDSARLSNQYPSRRTEIILHDVERVHGTPPGYISSLVNSIKTAHWGNEQWARGGFAAAYPGQKINLAYNALLPEYNGRIFFAGEHVSTKPGWIQGAMQTGKWAANQMALMFGQY